MTDIEHYEDPIIQLTRDPDLSKDKAKTTELLKIIHGFPLAERKVSKLCQSSFNILQTLEKLCLTFKSWEFLSLDFNSEFHFNHDDDKIKSFNNNVAEKVMATCNEMNKKLNRISVDIDYITKASRTLSPIEYISDSGTLLTSLVLRNIKLKTEAVDNLTVTYSKAKIILIGKDLENMLGDSEETNSTILTYKSFIVNLLKQLNNAVELEDTESKYECLAVINDMEQMFEAFKLEKATEVVRKNPKTYNEEDNEDEQEEYVDLGTETAPKTKPIPTPNAHTRRQNMAQRHHSAQPSRRNTPTEYSRRHSPNTPKYPVSDDEDYDYSDSDGGSNSLYSSTLSQPPIIHSITKLNDESAHSPRVGRRESMSSLSTSTLLHKTTISDELPYLMTAFSSAKNMEEDISHFKEEDEKQTTASMSASQVSSHKKRGADRTTVDETERRNIYSHKPKLPDNSLYSESVLLQQPHSTGTSPASSYLFSNSSLLAKLGIRPQVINSDLPASGKELSESDKYNQPRAIFPGRAKKQILDGEEEEINKENPKLLTPLTKANLESHTFSKLSPDNSLVDYVD